MVRLNVGGGEQQPLVVTLVLVGWVLLELAVVAYVVALTIKALS